MCVPFQATWLEAVMDMEQERGKAFEKRNLRQQQRAVPDSFLWVMCRVGRTIIIHGV